MEIRTIKKMKNDKYKISLDDENFIVYGDVIVNNNLLYKKQIDISLYEKIKEDNIYYEVYNKTLSFVLKKVRSKKEVDEFLKKFSIKDNLKKMIKDHLINIGLLSDIAYIKSYISDAIYINLDGPYKIKNFLLSNELDINDIDSEIKLIDSEIILNNLRRLINKKINHNHKLSLKQLHQKIRYEMNMRGYSFVDIDMVLSEFDLTNEEEILNKEFEKIYSKLSKKYTGQDLKNKVKQKLYIKGFQLDKINLLLEKKED